MLHRTTTWLPHLLVVEMVIVDENRYFTHFPVDFRQVVDIIISNDS